jgi:hypothetical protein
MEAGDPLAHEPAAPPGESLASIWKEHGKWPTDTQLDAMKSTTSATVDGIKYPSLNDVIKWKKNLTTTGPATRGDKIIKIQTARDNELKAQSSLAHTQPDKVGEGNGRAHQGNLKRALSAASEQQGQTDPKRSGNTEGGDASLAGEGRSLLAGGYSNSLGEEGQQSEAPPASQAAPQTQPTSTLGVVIMEPLKRKMHVSSISKVMLTQPNSLTTKNADRNREIFNAMRDNISKDKATSASLVDLDATVIQLMQFFPKNSLAINEVDYARLILVLNHPDCADAIDEVMKKGGKRADIELCKAHGKQILDPWAALATIFNDIETMLYHPDDSCLKCGDLSFEFRQPRTPAVLKKMFQKLNALFSQCYQVPQFQLKQRCWMCTYNHLSLILLLEHTIRSNTPRVGDCSLRLKLLSPSLLK